MTTTSNYQHMRHEEGRLGCVPQWHCHHHHVDEPSGYINCPECNHAYRTAGALKRAYLREHWRLWRMEMRAPLRPPAVPDADDLFGPSARVPRLVACWALLRAVFVRPSRISFCQECTHDF